MQWDLVSLLLFNIFITDWDEAVEGIIIWSVDSIEWDG